MMLVNIGVYPHNTKLDYDSGQLAMTYSLGELINKRTYNWDATAQQSIETDYTFPNSQESSNVYGWMDENCVFMKKRSNIATNLSTGVMTMNGLTAGAGNLRMMFRTDYPTDNYYASTDILQNKKSNTRYDYEATDNTEWYNSNTNHGYANSYVPIIRMRYDRLILFTLIRVTITDMSTGGISPFGISLSAIEAGTILNYTLTEEQKNELITSGHTVFGNSIIALSGVLIKPYYGSNAGTPDRKIASIVPTIETNMSNSVWFGCPSQTFISYNVNIEPGLTYYNSAWIGGLDNNGTNISAPLEFTSLSLMNMSTNYSFGVYDSFTIDMLNGTEYAAYTPHFTNNLCFVKYPGLNATCICTYYSLEECINMVASYGLYFCFDETLINEKLGQDLTNDNIYLGKMYSNGRCDGTYTQGLATKAEPQAKENTFIVSYIETDKVLEIEPIDPTIPYVPPEPPIPPSEKTTIPCDNTWSYNEKEDLIADTFPYIGQDGKNGEFMTMIRTVPKIKITKNDNNFEFSFDFYLEDVIRKSVGEQKYIIGRLSGTFSSDDNLISSRYYDYELEKGEQQILQKRIAKGFYPGEVVSYSSLSNPDFFITVNKRWLNQPADNSIIYNSKIVCENLLTGEIIEKEVDSSADSTVYFNDLKKYYNNQLVNYLVYEDSPREDFPWISYITTKNEINYESESKRVIIENRWNEISSVNDIIPIKISFTQRFNIPEIQEEVFKKDFGNKSPFDLNAKEDLSGFKSFLQYLEEDTAEKDWLNIIKDSTEYKSLPRNNVVALFCAEYNWHQYFLEQIVQEELVFEDWQKILPFCSIIYRNMTGEETIYSFRIRNANENNLTMNEIKYPYISKKIIADEDINIGAKSLILQWKMGAKNSFTEVAEDGDYPYDYENYYSGEPTPLEGPFPFLKTKSDFNFTSCSLLPKEDGLQMSNFCVYATDKMCADSNLITDLIPYYYKIELKETATSITFGELKATVEVLEKDSSFISGQTNIENYGPYNYHKWNNSPGQYLKNNENFEIDFEKMNRELEKQDGLFSEFLYDDNGEKIYKPVIDYGGDDDN